MTDARKWVAVDFGGPGVLRSIDVDVPGPGRGEATIGVRAIGVNPADAKHIAPGQDRKLLPPPIGYEVAGPSPRPASLLLVGTTAADLLQVPARAKARPFSCTVPPEPWASWCSSKPGISECG